MILLYNFNLKSRAKELRKNMTDAEIRVWKRIKGKQL